MKFKSSFNESAKDLVSIFHQISLKTKKKKKKKKKKDIINSDINAIISEI